MRPAGSPEVQRPVSARGAGRPQGRTQHATPHSHRVTTTASSPSSQGTLLERNSRSHPWERPLFGWGVVSRGRSASRPELFGARTGAVAALMAAAERPDRVAAVVSRSGRPHLVGPALERVTAPTLLIVGGADTQVLALSVRPSGGWPHRTAWRSCREPARRQLRYVT
jgi:hypothetical protein